MPMGRPSQDILMVNLSVEVTLVYFLGEGKLGKI